MAKQTFTTGQVLTAAQMTSLQDTAMGGGSPSTKTASYVLVAADAGTVIQMNAAGSTTITVNTALFSAGDSVQIQNIGAGVCTITAGTATVNTAGSLALSQWEGGFLYFTSASSAIFFDVVQSSGMTNPMTTTGDTIYSSSGSTPARLGIGTTGQVLTVASGIPSWATPATGGGMTLINTGGTTLSGSTTTISSIPGTYKNLQLIIRNFKPATDTAYLQLRFNGDSGAKYWRDPNASAATPSDTAYRLSPAQSNASDNGLTIVDIYDYAGTTWKVSPQWSITNASSTTINTSTNLGVYIGTSAISSIGILCSTGNFTSGTAYVYGVS